MSLMKARSRMANEAKAEEVDPTRCAAYGCKCRASVNNAGSGWACFAHAFAPVDDWQQITHRLHEVDWLLGLVDDMRRMDRLNQDWRGFAVQFWENHDRYCQPRPFESCTPYQNRMLLEVLYRIGQLPKRPVPREAAKVKPSGRFAKTTSLEAA
jgi:hypothetical protein